jgi:pteridine reductase
MMLNQEAIVQNTSLNCTQEKPRAVVLITGAARRVGAEIARTLFQRGVNVALHYHSSEAEVSALAKSFNEQRAHSAIVLQANLLDLQACEQMIESVVAHYGRLDGLVNNASSFYATPLTTIKEEDWLDLMGSNARAPLFLSQAAYPHLSTTQGAIVGLIDIHAERPMKNHLVYSLAKATHAQLIRGLAIEMAPHVRCNGVAPGVNVWPENDHSFNDASRAEIEKSIPLGRAGTPADLAIAVAFLLLDAHYVTGQILAVDGGRSCVLA